MSTNQNQAHGYRLAAIDLDGTLLAPDHTISPANARAVERLQAAGIEVVLASGRHQGTMVAFARALANRPEVVLLDEPFGALDAKVRKDLRRWLREFHDLMRLTTIFVTHDQDEAFEVADRVVLINKGSIQQSGTPTEVRNNPANSFVAEFLGLPEKYDPLARNESQLQTR